MVAPGERFIAGVPASGCHLPLMSEMAPFTARVYDLKGKKVLFKESAENLEVGKAEGERFAKELFGDTQ